MLFLFHHRVPDRPLSYAVQLSSLPHPIACFFLRLGGKARNHPGNCHPERSTVGAQSKDLRFRTVCHKYLRGKPDDLSPTPLGERPTRLPVKPVRDRIGASRSFNYLFVATNAAECISETCYYGVRRKHKARSSQRALCFQPIERCCAAK